MSKYPEKVFPNDCVTAHCYIKKWIQNPGDIKPGNLMYDSENFSDEELDALAEYLMSLKAQN